MDLKRTNPTPKDLKDFRSRYHLTQTEAAVLALSSLRSWQYWERGAHVMHRAIWRYVQIAARALARHATEGKPRPLFTIGDV